LLGRIFSYSLSGFFTQILLKNQTLQTAPGGWNKPSNAKGPGPYSPIGISPKGLFPPGAGISMVNFNGVLEALTAGKDGSIYVSWVVGTGKWEGPVRIY
jgi:hypothetical protein